MDKVQILRRIGIILNDVKRMVGHSKFLGEEVEEIEIILDETEKQYAALVDDYMAYVIEYRSRMRYGGKNKSKQGKKNFRLDE